jgi:2-polyprenyl-3-methyl-5-hydroxy-6-metoxy-1,4-benzoquinol methylase
MSSTVQRHFERQSSQYTASSGALLWRWQRTRETAAVDNLMGDVSGEEILDLGCGTGHYTRHFLDVGARHITAVDFSPSMISQLPNSGVTGIVEDVTKVRFGQKFPMIICAGVLEFVSSPEALLGHARNLISESGAMVCLLPPDNWAGRLYRAYHWRHDFEIGLFKNGHFEDMCGKSGWGIEARRFVFPYSAVYRLTPLAAS